MIHEVPCVLEQEHIFEQNQTGRPTMCDDAGLLELIGGFSQWRRHHILQYAVSIVCNVYQRIVD